VGEVEQVTKVEQLLLDGHKKSDARRLASDSDWPGCLSEQHYGHAPGFLFAGETRRYRRAMPGGMYRFAHRGALIDLLVSGMFWGKDFARRQAALRCIVSKII
ncbi:hypothetical protein, partial [Stenotrophomonas cyclobalanopsidis]|uniref:hypothetical protein n=1 Tax=Stenotrophomonas cyclobalanopsidis TaxID=2771362 RepID=UPI001FED1E27